MILKLIKKLRIYPLKTLIEFEKQFQSAIKYRLISDVEVGSCLSGGLDSSSIVVSALNYITERKKFKTFQKLKIMIQLMNLSL